MTACRYCSTTINWTRREGRNIPVEASGKEHVCALKPRSIARHQGSRRANTMQGEHVVGQLYRANCGECSVPPWESCACSFKEAA